MNAYIQDLAEGKIDFHGQLLVDQISRAVLIGFTVISFVLGFALQSLSVTFGVFGIAATVLFLIVIPPWPMFNRHPVKWLPVLDVDEKKGR